MWLQSFYKDGKLNVRRLVAEGCLCSADYSSVSYICVTLNVFMFFKDVKQCYAYSRYLCAFGMS